MRSCSGYFGRKLSTHDARTHISLVALRKLLHVYCSDDRLVFFSPYVEQGLFGAAEDDGCPCREHVRRSFPDSSNPWRRYELLGASRFLVYARY